MPEVGMIWTFDYTGAEQTFKISRTCTYKIELWGAQGGSYVEYIGGKGAYTSGIINLARNNKIYIYVGKQGDNSSERIYNNGSIACKYNNISYGASGGGATDIRTIDGKWDDFSSLISRIMVAAGGGGAIYIPNDLNCFYCQNGGSGGGLIGENGNLKVYILTDTNATIASGATQISGGKNGNNNTYQNFGIVDNIYGSAKGGGGYYSGGNGYRGDSITGTGAGGSSFVSGHDGCDAIKEKSTENNIIHTGQSIHYSGLYFTNTIMIDGAGYNWTTEKEKYVGMPTHDGKDIMDGNKGNGYAKITLISY